MSKFEKVWTSILLACSVVAFYNGYLITGAGAFFLAIRHLSATKHKV